MLILTDVQANNHDLSPFFYILIDFQFSLTLITQHLAPKVLV